MAKWTLDPTHSEIHFKVKHLVISTVSGSFQKFEGELNSDKPDFTDAIVTASVDVNSITTNQPQRDEHLKSPDFFDAANHPEITFKSTRIEKDNNDEYLLTGDLNIRGTTKPVTLKVEFGGAATDSYGQSKAGFEASGKINRQDYGLRWSAMTEAGGLVVSDEVKIELNVQFVKQA